MKKFQAIALLGVLLAALLFPISASAQGQALFPDKDDKVVFGGSFTLSEGERLFGDLISFGGSISIKQGATLQGTLIAMGGSADIAGEISGDFVAMGTTVNLMDSAYVVGDMAMLGASLNREAGAQVIGDVITDTVPLSFDIPGMPNIQLNSDAFIFGGNADESPQIAVPEAIAYQRSLAGRVANEVQAGLFNAFAMAAIAILAILFLPAQTKRVAHTSLGEPLAAGGLSLISMIILPILMIFMSITIILIPIVILLAFLIVLALVFGWVSVGWELGERLLKALNLDWAEPLQAGVGAFVLTFVAALIGLVPCLGWLATFLVLLTSFGGVLLSRFGTQDYPALEIIVAEPKALTKTAPVAKKAPAKKKAPTKKAPPKKSSK